MITTPRMVPLAFAKRRDHRLDDVPRRDWSVVALPAFLSILLAAAVVLVVGTLAVAYSQAGRW